MAKPQKSVVVTGVSSGIGLAIAKAMVDEGWRVFGSVRKQSDADAVAQTLGDAFTPLIFDVTDQSAIDDAAALVADMLEGRTLGGLVNNAGVAVAGPLRYIPLEDIERQMNINLYGAIRVTQAFVGLLGADKLQRGKPGKILNMSSVAGKIASPIMGPYSMSKHALEAYSDSLRRELLMHGIDVVIIAPGAIKTPIWDKADDIDTDRYQETEYFDVMMEMREKYKELGDSGLPPEAVGARARDVLTGRNKAVRHALLNNKLAMWTLPRLMPTRLLDKAIADRFGFPKKSS